MLYFHGYDLSLTGTGIVVLDENRKVVYKNTITTAVVGTERLSRIRIIVKDVIERFPPTMICIEDYIQCVNGKNAGKAFHIGELGGTIKLMLYDMDLDPVLVNPKTVKKYVSDNGNTNKNMMIMLVYKNFHEETSTDDEADAYALAHIAHAIYNECDDLESFQSVVIYNLTHPETKPIPEKKRKKVQRLKRRKV